MNNITKILLGMLFLILMSCQEEYGVQVRIENSSDFTFQEVSINNVPFGTLKPNEVSGYVPFEAIYETEYIQVFSDDKEYKIIPENFDSDNVYQTGSFKFSLDITQSDNLTISFSAE